MTAGGQAPGARVVPVYAVTQGRTRPAGQELPFEALVTVTDRAARADVTLHAEWREIVRMCVRPMSVAEIGAALQVPVGVARVLVGDLAGAGYLAVHLPRPAAGDGAPDPAILGRLLDGLRSG